MIFTHQAALAGTIAAVTTPAERVVFTGKVNFPLHLYERMPVTDRPQQLDELALARYDNLANETSWIDRYPMSDSCEQVLSIVFR